MGEPCGCEESVALRAENEGLSVEVKQYRLGNEKLRDLARELLKEMNGAEATHMIIRGYGVFPSSVSELFARAKALGVEVGR